MTMEKQQSWGWQVVLDVFVGGIGAGLLLVSFLLERTHGATPLTEAGCLIGPLLVIVGVVVLMLELGKPVNMPLAFVNFGTSWMSRGVVLQPLFIGAGLLYGLLPVWVAGFKNSGPGILIGTVAALLAILLAVYHGLLYSKAKGIALWNSPLLPMLYFVSSVAGGAAVLLLLSPFLSATAGQLRLLAAIETALVCLVLISIWLMASVQPSVAYRESLKKLFSVSFIIFSIAIGTGIPLVLLIISIFAGQTAIHTSLLALCGALILIGTFHLRHTITNAGFFYSLRLAF
ncbi:MAG: DmsC/YnfH family molybdoenzyme membrane anchor subunit [Desulfobacterales bacterium]|nr:DmsC/YnfH family molybdoenzyme membrane anchor subunit [Desulfobacterales bacterium]